MKKLPYRNRLFYNHFSQQTDGPWINRDIVGARNILLRALVDQPHLFSGS